MWTFPILLLGLIEYDDHFSAVKNVAPVFRPSDETQPYRHVADSPTQTTSSQFRELKLKSTAEVGELQRILHYKWQDDFQKSRGNST